MSDLVKGWREYAHSIRVVTPAVSYADDMADEIERNREAIAELRSALKLALKALPFSTHPDAFEAVQIAEKLLNKTKEGKQ